MPVRLAQQDDENEYIHPAKPGVGIGMGIALGVWQGSHWTCAAHSIPIPIPIPNPKYRLFS
jgi:hypothetical protein